MRHFVSLALLALLFASCGRAEDDVQCVPVPPSRLLRFRLVDSAGTDLLKGGAAGIRVSQPCRRDSLYLIYSLYSDTSGKTTTVLGFDNLDFPLITTGAADSACFRILFDFPSGDQDTVTWSFHINDDDICRTPVIDEVRFNGVNASPGGPDLLSDRRYYLLVKR